MPAISNGIEFEVNYNKTKCCFRVGGVMSFFLFLFFFCCRVSLLGGYLDW